MPSSMATRAPSRNKVDLPEKVNKRTSFASAKQVLNSTIEHHSKKTNQSPTFLFYMACSMDANVRFQKTISVIPTVYQRKLWKEIDI